MTLAIIAIEIVIIVLMIGTVTDNSGQVYSQDIYTYGVGICFVLTVLALILNKEKRSI